MQDKINPDMKKAPFGEDATFINLTVSSCFGELLDSDPYGNTAQRIL